MNPAETEDPFARHRSLLFTVAYELLGTAADAEDVLQDAWLRWSAVDQTTVTEPKAYAVRIVTRTALNRLRTLSRRRESYVGPWLPEPIATTPDVAEDVALADSVSLAMLVVLDSLATTERAVFLLREVFGFSYAEIAEMVERSPDAVRQMAHRARTHVAQRRPRAEASRSELKAATDRFAQAAVSGDPTDLLTLIAPDVVLVTDGGGRKQAALRPILGLEKVLRFLGAVRNPDAEPMEVVEVNGQPALLSRIDGMLDAVLLLQMNDAQISQVYVIRNPEKLAEIDVVRQLSR